MGPPGPVEKRSGDTMADKGFMGMGTLVKDGPVVCGVRRLAATGIDASLVGAVVITVVAWVGQAVVMADGDQPSLDELLGIPGHFEVGPAQPESGPGDAKPQPGSEAQTEAQLLGQLSDDQPGDVFDQAIHQMNEAADRLGGQLDTGFETQRLQQAVLDKLDQLIAAARNQGSGSGSGVPAPGGPSQQESGSAQNMVSGQATNGDASQSGAGGGASGSGGAGRVGQHDAGVMESHRSQWGNLPPRVRDQLLEGLNEQFSSIYRQLTSQYYRRLAEENR